MVELGLGSGRVQAHHANSNGMCAVLSLNQSGVVERLAQKDIQKQSFFQKVLRLSYKEYIRQSDGGA